ncbi:hypothetical protein ACIGO6_00675 [Streptomyces sp. NPDC053750]|uniref:hypothetical protein n=1 Tax=Streptomyces sp. NPDC053750 TaxID=3365714 RepID=UPI0037D50F97
MSTPVHRTSERPSVAALTAARQRRGEGRAGSSSGSSGTSAERALLGLQSSAGNQAATATVQRARGRTLERTPGTDTTRPGSAPGVRRAPAGRARRGSESGTPGTAVGPDLQEQVDTAMEEARRAAAARAAAEEAERRANLAARFTPSGRTRRGSETDTRPDPAGLTRRGSESGTHTMAVDPEFQEQVDTAIEEAHRAAEEARRAAEEAERRAALAARFTPSGRTRRGSETDTRPHPATLTRRDSASGTQGMEVDPEFQEQVDTAREEARRAAEEARRAAEEAERRAALAARFTPSGRTRRGSEADTRPDPVNRTRRGSESGLPDTEFDPRILNRPETTTPAETEQKAEASEKSDRFQAAAQAAEPASKLLASPDALGKGALAPTSGGGGQAATEATQASAQNPDAAAAAAEASKADALKHDAAAAGVSGASLSTLTELLALTASLQESVKNLKTSLKKKTGAGYHNARKKFKSKATDSAVSVASTGANTGAIAKDAVKFQGTANTLAAAEASGVLSAVAGLAKSIRSLGKVVRASSKYRKLKKLGDAGVKHANLLNTLQAEMDRTAGPATAVYDDIVALQREADSGRTRDGWQEALDQALADYQREAGRHLEAKRAYVDALRDVNTLVEMKKYAKDKQVSKIGKETVSGMGEGAKGAAGIVTVAALATLGSNPAGWIIAAVGAGIVLTVAGYKGFRAARKRFQEEHHPERYTPEGEEMPVAKPTWESLKHAMKVWKKVSKHKRRLAAHKIYNMVSSPDTPAELRLSALELLVAINATPEKHNMKRPEWEASLMNPADKAHWIKEITDQLASA